MSDTFFMRICRETTERMTTRGFGRAESLEVARDEWEAMRMQAMGLRRYGGDPDPGEGPIVFHGPAGKVTVRPNDDLPSGMWSWREPSPFERWFPTHEGA